MIAGFVDAAGGIAALAPKLDVLGTGVVLAIVSLVLATDGGWASRRFTTWIWSAGFAGGVVIVGDIASDSFVGAGIALMIAGAIVVAAATVVSVAHRERLDVELAEPAPVA